MTQSPADSAPDLSLADIDPTDDRQLEAWERHTLEQGFATVLAESDRLRQLGIIDDAGRLLNKPLDDVSAESSTDDPEG